MTDRQHWTGSIPQTRRVVLQWNNTTKSFDALYRGRRVASFKEGYDKDGNFFLNEDGEVIA